jgi:hypothetical protein
MNIEEQFFEAMGIEADNSETAYFTGRLGAYPTITDTIVLRLEDVICYKYGIFKKGYSQVGHGGTYKFGYSLPDKHLSCYGDTRLEALLRLCIQLKDEIREEVQDIFN